MLLISGEHRLEFRNSLFQSEWRVHGLIPYPHFLDEFSELYSQFAFSPQFIKFVDLSCIEFVEEVQGQGNGIAQTLQCTVHKTSVSNIL